MEDLHKACSLAQRGTLAQLRNSFGHTHATADTGATFTHTEDLIRFSSEAHIVLLATDLLGINLVTDSPSLAHNSKLELLISTSQKIVDIVWLLPTQSEIDSIIDAEVDSRPWCFCGEGNIIFITQNE
jgi:hypothetical protein